MRVGCSLELKAMMRWGPRVVSVEIVGRSTGKIVYSLLIVWELEHPPSYQ